MTRWLLFVEFLLLYFRDQHIFLYKRPNSKYLGFVYFASTTQLCRWNTNTATKSTNGCVSAPTELYWQKQTSLLYSAPHYSFLTSIFPSANVPMWCPHPLTPHTRFARLYFLVANIAEITNPEYVLFHRIVWRVEGGSFVKPFSVS